jgi:hypothetical protein
MPLSPPSRALLKTLTLVAAVGGALYLGHAWLNTPDPATEAEPGDMPAPTTPPPSNASAKTPGDRLNAQEVAQAYARSPQEADARFKGQRLRLHGVVEQLEAGQGQILLVTLGSADGQAGLRAVVDMGMQDSQVARPVLGQSLSLECLNQGLLMGEPVLSDCRLLP